MRILNLVLFLALAPTVYASGPEAGENLAEVVATRTYAIPDKHEPPRYPTKALRSGTEGWVVANFSIKEDGTTDDISVKSASIDGYFEKETIRAIRAWTYEPATLNGSPVSQGNRQARHVYRITNTQSGVSKAFHKQYKAALEAIKDGALDQASEMLENLDSNKKRLLTEVFFLDVLHAAYWQGKDDQKKRLRYIERALIIADEVAKRGMHINLLRQAIVANSIAGNYARVLKHYDTLTKVAEDLSPEDPVHGLIAKVNQLLDGDEMIVTEGRIFRCTHCKPVRSSWRRTLNRKSFSIDSVVGEINEIEVICDLKSVTLDHNPDIIFNIQKDWELCTVRLIGDEDTTFRLVEFPEESAPGSTN